MKGLDPYEAWRRARREPEIGGNFADRVMARVRRYEAARQAAPAGRDVAGWMFSRRWVAAALLVLGFGAGLIRFGWALAVILCTPAGGF